MRKPKSRNRSFQSHGAGKGSADRTTDDAAYRRNFEAIDWGRGPKGYFYSPVDDDCLIIMGDEVFHR